MYFRYCGNKIEDDHTYCSKCGKSINEEYMAKNNEITPISSSNKTKSSIELKTLVILAAVFSVIFPLVGLILSIIAIAKDDTKKYKSLTTVALILSLVFLIIETLLVAIR